MTLRKANQFKVKLSGLFFLLIVLVPISSQRANSVLSPDAYWRYKGSMLVTSILQTNRLPLNKPFSDHSFLTQWVNSNINEFIVPTIVSQLHLVTGIDPTLLQTLPLFTIPLLLGQALLGSRLVGDRGLMFPVAVLLAIASQFVNPHILGTAHRATYVWAMFFTLLAFLVMSRNKGRAEQYFVFIVILIPFVISENTFPFSSVVFFSILFLLSIVNIINLLNKIKFFTILLILSFYYTLVFIYTPTIVAKFSTAIAYSGGIRIVETLLNFGDSLDFSSSLSAHVDPYLLQQTFPEMFTGIIWLARIVPVICGISAVIYTGLKIREGWLSNQPIQRTLGPIDAVLIGLSVQVAVDIAVLRLFYASGGLNPVLLGIFFFPVYGTAIIKILSNWIIVDGESIKRVVVVGLCLSLLILPGLISAIWLPYLPDRPHAVSHEGVQQAENLDQFASDQRIISDFETLSVYYAVGGSGPSHIPPTGEPSYGTKERQEELIATYYESPTSADDHGDIFAVSEKMSRTSMYHVNSMTTIPNSNLEKDFGRDKGWGKVYTSGGGFNFADL